MDELANLSASQKRRLLKMLEKKEAIKKYGGHMHKIWPEEGELSYDKYPRHMEVIKATAIHKEILFLAANRAGKTQLGAYCVACWATGVYPSWWQGRKFEGPVDIWVAGDTSQTTRDVPQKELMGPPGELGTGMIARDCIIKTTAKAGVPEGFDTVIVKHVPSGSTSRIGFKSYDQGRKSFQGTAKHIIWTDEEPSDVVYGEALIRTMTTGGLVLATLTPLEGWTEFITHFMDGAQSYTDEDEEAANE